MISMSGGGRRSKEEEEEDGPPGRRSEGIGECVRREEEEG
ncbi:hypothetical protein E2C01_095110 [Portunus trituberculatus]|uniref:Uncharacterized protein n=1 Tax=Portunus trituberculatus TaxID=210409 RepID=A0A5B7JUG5_PORTR|nr:hypothetical protein [Portunus trituberculatus]